MKSHRGVFLVLGIVVFLCPIACGKKGPPFLPKKNGELKAEALRADWVNDTIVIEGRVLRPRGQEGERPRLVGCRVYHAYYPLEAQPCEDCPIQYQSFKDVEGESLPQEKFRCKFLQPKIRGVHFFQVRLLGPEKESGPPSDRVKLVVR